MSVTQTLFGLMTSKLRLTRSGIAAAGFDAPQYRMRYPCRALMPPSRMRRSTRCRAAGFSRLAQIEDDAPRAIYAMACLIGGADEPQKAHVLFRSIRERISKPCVVAGACDIEDAAHRAHVILVPVCLDELVCTADAPRS